MIAVLAALVLVHGAAPQPVDEESLQNHTKAYKPILTESMALLMVAKR
jgi:hypothetical protein